MGLWTRDALTAAGLTGLVPATLTPFDEAGRLAGDRIAAHVEFLVGAGIRALAPGGTTGECLYLTDKERERLIEATLDAAAGRAKVIAGVWALDSGEVARLARRAETLGADAVFLTTPIYYPAGEEVILEWYRNVRRSTGLPIFAYNIPQCAVNVVTEPAFRRLLDEGTVQGIKDSTADAGRLQQLLAARAGTGLVFAASDSFIRVAAELGADGFVSAIANVYPEACRAAWTGDGASQFFVDGVRSAIKRHGGIPALKALLERRGVPSGRSRLPFAELSVADRELLAESIAKLQ